MQTGATPPATERYFYNPIKTTAQYAVAPITWVLGYFVRIGAFSFAEWNKSWFKSKVIDFYTGGGNFSTPRLEKAFTSLESVGGIRTPTFSKDGTKLDTMLIRYRDVKATIEKMGGRLVQSLPVSDLDTDHKEKITLCKENRSRPHEYIDLILPPEKKSQEWDEFCKTTLDNLGLEKTTIHTASDKLVNGYITNHWNEKNPNRPKIGQCFVRLNSPTETYACAKRDIMRRIFLGQDVLCFDPPGTWKSEGTPSEGGDYLAAETMVEKAVNDYGYKWTDLWVDGFCKGGSSAFHCKMKYHDKGINVLVQNTFDKMENTLNSQVFPASHVAQYGLNAVKSKDPFIVANTIQDGYDNIRKLESLQDKPQMGTTIIVNTDTDKTLHPKSHYALAAVSHQVSAKNFAILYHHPDRNKNGHRFDVLSNPKTWRKVVNSIAAKDQGWFSSLWSS